MLYVYLLLTNYWLKFSNTLFHDKLFFDISADWPNQEKQICSFHLAVI